MSEVTERIAKLERLVETLRRRVEETQYEYPARKQDGILRDGIDRAARFSGVAKLDLFDDLGAADAMGLLKANVTLDNLTTTAVNADVDPGTDAARKLGTSTFRWSELNVSTGVFFWVSSGDAQPATKMLAGGFEFGAGGASSTDVTIGRLAANVLGLGAGDEFRLQGGTSGYVGIISPSAPTSWTLTLPTDVPGGNGYALTATTGGVASWTNLAALYQPLDSDLSAIALLTTTGLLARTGSGAWANRTIQQGASISVTNGDGVSGDPTIAVSYSASTGWAASNYTPTKTLDATIPVLANTTNVVCTILDRLKTLGLMQV